MDALIGAADQGVSPLDVCIDAAISARPIGMFAEQTNTPWNENFHGEYPYYGMAQVYP